MTWTDQNKLTHGAFSVPFFPWLDGWRFGIVFNDEEMFFGWYRKE